MITTNRKEWLSLPEYFALTLLCSISSSNPGSLLLIYQNDSPPSEEKEYHRRRKACCSGRSSHVLPGVLLIQVLLIWTLNHWLSTLTSDLPGHHGPAWWSLGYDLILTLTLPWGLIYVLNLGSASSSHTCLMTWALGCPPTPGWGWWNRPWLATVSPAAPGFPALWSSWNSCHQERAAHLWGYEGY